MPQPDIQTDAAERKRLRRALRETLRERRRGLSPAERIAAAEAVAGRLLALPSAPRSGHVAGYWANDGELALHVWQLRLPAEVRYCLPVLGDDRALRFVPWRAGEPLVTNRYGIPEPERLDHALPAEAMDMIVLPLVGFDSTGQRLGMGGGWYDRTLAFRRDRGAPPHLVGVGFETQRLASLQAEPWDVPLDAVCTEADTLLFPEHPSVTA